jgi:Ca2+-binding RTX toxin-like protein
MVNAGQGADAVFGDGGDDWIEGGSGQDLLQGDHGGPFFDDPAELKPGNDIFIGQVGENDYDAEGGDDIMEQNAAIDRNAGAAGFDWAMHQNQPDPRKASDPGHDDAAANDDMMINQGLVGLPLQVVVNRDRWQETEADSGGQLADIIRGDDLERVVGPGGFSGCDALDAAGVARINGLDRYVTEFPTLLSDVITASAMKRCPLTGSGPNGTGVWAEGNILLGGGSSDVIEGRANNDIIDGDNSLNVFLSVRDHLTGNELGRTDRMDGKPLSGVFLNGQTAPLTLHQAVFSGALDAGDIVAVREIQDRDGNLLGSSPDRAVAGTCVDGTDINVIQHSDVPPLSENCDVSEYTSGPENFTVAANGDGSFTVTDATTVAAAAGAVGPIGKGDGIDTLWNVEALRFCINNDAVTKNCDTWETLAIDDPALTGAGGPASAELVGTSPVAFGTLTVGTGPSTQAITIRNAGGGFLTGSPATLASGVDFSITADGCDTTVLGANGTCAVTVAFNPLTAGAKTDTLTIPTDHGNVDVVLNGTGVAVNALGQLSIARPANFGTRRIGDPARTQPVTIRNTGTAALGTIAASSSTSDFQVAIGTCGVDVAPNKTCQLQVTFIPALPIGPKSAILTVTSNGSNPSVTVPLTGASKEAAVVVGALRIVQPPAPTSVKPINVSLHVSTAASIRLQVRKTNGKLVWSKRITARKAGTAKLRWNLRDAKGHRVKKGKYVFTITVIDNTGFKVVVKRTVRVR